MGLAALLEDLLATSSPDTLFTNLLVYGSQVVDVDELPLVASPGVSESFCGPPLMRGSEPHA